jgi:hypothetical protein
MDALILLVGLWINGLFLFRREWLMEEEKYQLILRIAGIGFLVGLALHLLDGMRFYTSGALLAPLLALGLFRLFRRIFIMRFGREPRDTHISAGPGMAADSFFNILYACSCMLILFLTTVGMYELTKSGW